MKVVELFSGIGSQSRALKRIGVTFDVTFTCEWDIRATLAYSIINKNSASLSAFYLGKDEILKKLSLLNISCDCKNKISYNYLKKMPVATLNLINNAIRSNNNLVNIMSVHGKDLGDDIDLLTYSFPCQDLSNVGALHGYNKGIDKNANNRSYLLWDVGRILNERKELGLILPQFLVLENVSTLLSARHRDNFNEWRNNLVKLGYYNHVYRLNAKDFGIPQHRNRLIMISILTNNNEKIEKEIAKYFSIYNLEDKEYINKLDIKKVNLVDSLKLDYNNPKYLSEALEAQPNDTASRRKIWKDNLQIVNDEGLITAKGYTATLTTKQDRHPNSGNIYFNPNNNKSRYRFLTPRECFLLMGFDEEDYEKIVSYKIPYRQNAKFFSRDVLYHLTGNSIVVPILEYIFRQIIQIKNEIFGEKAI